MATRIKFLPIQILCHIFGQNPANAAKHAATQEYVTLVLYGFSSMQP